ncbi:N-acetylmuramoyl-L-alanine amidase family protein [Oceaniferula marina]|uniref:N-acetylmuramoyl-L-alanine amidase family protein n=1 Tax=Oceaniferula marina TaxID=2748318 RepID=UPI0015BC55EA|nr:N-acetylmuramoyl-L-alanine amidase [Oceaniferula marina]
MPLLIHRVGVCRCKRFAAGSLVCISIFLAACAHSGGGDTPSAGKQSLKRDYWGHRPGPKGFRTVIIDAGHGGKDSGARGHGAVEKDLALDTAKRLKRKLAGKFKVVMIRSSDQFVDLDDRVAKANRYDSAILVSLHYNSSRSRSTRGPETYYWRVDSYSLAWRIQRELAKVSPSEYRSRGLVRRRLRLTRNTRIPSVLVELGYLTHASEARLCRSAGYRDRLASALAKAISEQRAHGDTGTGRLPRPIYKPLSKASDPPGS